MLIVFPCPSWAKTHCRARRALTHAARSSIQSPNTGGKMKYVSLGTACTVTLFVAIAFAQTFTGTITGTVTDPAGAVVPGAVLTVTNLETNESRRLTSSEAGIFSFTALPPGRYRFEVERAGFK